MDSLAYLHLALVYEGVDTSSDRPLSGVNWSKLSTSAFVHFLSIALSLGILSIAVQASAAVQFGDNNPEVTAVQERLRQLRYFNTTPTGYFGKITKDAVMRFQRDRGLTSDGVVGTRTYNALFFGVRSGSYSTNPSQSYSTNPSQSYSYYPMLQRGDNNDTVRQLKQWLAVNGYNRPTIDNDFDLVTEAELRRFQRDKRLTVTGVTDRTTWIALLNYGYPGLEANNPLPPLPLPFTPPFPDNAPSSKGFNPKYPSVPSNCSLKMGDRGSAVTNLQKYLISLNYLQGSATGYYDLSTREAVSRFQIANNLYVTGIADADTQRILFQQANIYEPLPGVQNLNAGWPILQEGSNQKAAVRYLQQQLKDKGFYTNGGITGNFASKTKKAVMDLQEYSGLEPTGVVDSATWRILNSAPNMS
jgi:peptidoglycan hydrolase-like protein with peptidoglycan-binding domain